MKSVDLTKSKTIPISFIDENEARNQSNTQKGWSFSYVFHFSELRDIYLILRDTEFSRPKDIYNNITRLGLSYVRTPWEERRILEQINALKNFNLIGEEGTILKNVFTESELGTDITNEELSVFSEIFFSYFRFREMHSWFIGIDSLNRSEMMKEVTREILKEESQVLFPFIKESRFTDSFLTEIRDGATIFNINKKNEDLMRFWDVFVKWGQTLGLLEKISLKELDIQFSTGSKSLSCVYFRKQGKNTFDLCSFLKEEYNSKYIQIPKLVFRIACKYRFSIDDIKDIIISQSLNNSDFISLQRTSEVFIRGKGKVLFPKFRGSYVSHLMLHF